MRFSFGRRSRCVCLCSHELRTGLQTLPSTWVCCFLPPCRSFFPPFFFHGPNGCHKGGRIQVFLSSVKLRRGWETSAEPPPAKWSEGKLLGIFSCWVNCPFRPRAGGRRSCIPPGGRSQLPFWTTATHVNPHLLLLLHLFLLLLLHHLSALPCRHPFHSPNPTSSCLG